MTEVLHITRTKLLHSCLHYLLFLITAIFCIIPSKDNKILLTAMAAFSPDSTEPVYFWKPEAENGFLGQWWPSSFKWEDGEKTYTYANAEQ